MKRDIVAGAAQADGLQRIELGIDVKIISRQDVCLQAIGREGGGSGAADLKSSNRPGSRSAVRTDKEQVRRINVSEMTAEFRSGEMASTFPGAVRTWVTELPLKIIRPFWLKSVESTPK